LCSSHRAASAPWRFNRTVEKSLAALFLKTASEAPDEIALRTPGGGLEATWAQYAERAKGIGAALWAIGVRRGDTVALMLSNRPGFNVADAGAFLIGATPFSIYNTLAANQITYLLENSGARVAICENEYVERLQLAAEGTPLEHIICVDAPAPEGAMTLAEFEEQALEDFDVDATAADVGPQDIATLIYTSGTTGPPKGVELSHGALLRALEAFDKVVPMQRAGRLISYLPSAHAADRFFSHYIGIYSRSTITALADARQAASLLTEVRPTSWSAVPRIWEKLKAALEARMDDRTRAAVAVGLRKVRAEQAALKGEGDGPDDALLAEYAAVEPVLGALRAAIGLDAADWTMSGAAPIAPEVLEFFLALGVPVCELWGMSEMLGGTINPPGRVKLGSVGVAVPGVQLRLADDGELLIKSPFMMSGYRNEPEKTREAIDEDGWLHTGDIAEIDDDGYVKIVDRKKELIINAGGKNMSPTNIENALKGACPLIAQAVAIGDRRPYNVALITLERDALNGRPPDDERVLEAVRRGVEEGNARLARVEQIKKYKVLADEWLPGGDEVTPTMKLKRKPIAEKYAAEIEELYAG